MQYSFAKLTILLLILLAACDHKTPIPFPEDTTEYQQPQTSAIKFGEADTLAWPEKGIKLTSTPAKFNFQQLPEQGFDSLGFQPFAVAPVVSPFDYEKLQKRNFSLDSIKSVPIRFKTFVLPAPVVTKVGKPVLKGTAAGKVYEFGDQLSGVNVFKASKGLNGLTWMATSKGLFKYDGENLTLYNVPGLNAQVNDMVEDKEGKLWIASAGLFVVDFINGVTKRLSEAEGLTADLIVRILIDHQNRVWATCFPRNFSIVEKIDKGFVLVINKASNTMKIIREEDGLSANNPVGIIEDREKKIWITTIHKGVSIIEPETNQIIYLSEKDGIANDTLTVLQEDYLGRIWLQHAFGNISVIDPNSGTITKLGEQQGSVRSFSISVLPDSYNNVWIGSNLGISVIDSRLQQIKRMDNRSGLLTGQAVNFMLDEQNQLLLTSKQGLNIIPQKGSLVQKIGSMEVSTMLEDSRGRVWIGTLEKGIQILDTATGRVKLYNNAHGLSDNQIQYLVEYNGNILLSTQAGGIEIIDTSLTKIERVGVAQGLTINLTTIEKDRDDHIWVAGIGRGISIVDLGKKEIKSIGAAEGLKDSAIIDIKRDGKGRMWLFSWTKGVGVIDMDNKTIRHINQADFASLTGSRENNMLMMDSRGNTWLMSSTNGLFMIHASGDSVSHFTTAQGLLSNEAQSLKEYKGSIYVGTNGGLNIMTPPSPGINDKWKVERFSNKEGFVKAVASYNSDLILKKGEYWWGDAGITILKNLDSRYTDSTIPKTWITGIDIFNRPLHLVEDPWSDLSSKDTIWGIEGKDTLTYTGSKSRSSIPWLEMDGITWDSLNPSYQIPVNLSLPYNKNYLQFHFAQAHLGTTDTVWYRYMLEGIDQKWSERTNKASSENYPGMAPGNYTFKVSSLYNGKWSEPISYSFTIRPPWWKTWWAFLLYALIGALIIRAYIVYRSKRLKRENKILEEKISLRTSQLQESIEELKSTQSQLVQSEKMASLGELTAGIAHEIQNPLNFINNFSEINIELITDMKEELMKGNFAEANLIANDISGNEEKINHHGKRADAIVKSMLQHSRSTSAAVKEPTDINKLADEYFRLAYHGLRAKDKSFNATLKTDYDNSIGMINIISQDIGRVILNLITNAFYVVGERSAFVKSAEASAVAKALAENLAKADASTKDEATADKYQPTVTVSTRKKGDKVEIEVADNGNGIPERVLAKIFQPFFTTKPAGKGTGLGLSLAYDIVKAHSGELRVETKEGEGTRFIIELPIK